MTTRERILSVYRGETPDAVPFMLDLSHWFYHRFHRPWDLSRAYESPESDLIAYHRAVGAGFYMPNLGSFYRTAFPADVEAGTRKISVNGADEIAWTLRTARGVIERRRRWEEQTYAWGMSQWGVRTEDDLRVFGDAMARRTFSPRWEQYEAWAREVGDLGVVYLGAGYSAIGQLLNYWMGIEGVMYAVADWPDTMREVVDRVNANNLELIDLLARSPAPVIGMGDNFSSDIQSPPFFAEWSRAYYTEAIRRLHAAGKRVSVHIDGRLRGAIRMLADCGIDCVDAVTPKPMGDVDPEACRDEAGPDVILSGGVSPDLWYASVPERDFTAAVRAWLALKRRSPRLIAAAGDQVPPGADEGRIRLMRDLVETEGRYGSL